jgi:hypothetical protein
MKKFLYWTPRILSIILVGFISLFALDIFSQDYTGWELIFALVMHLVPSFVAVVFIVIAWKWEHIGGWLFILLGGAYIFIGRFELMAILIFTLPLVVIGVLYLVHHYKYQDPQV